MYELNLSASEKAHFLEAARLAGYWLLNSQNTPQRPWGGYHVAQSADRGRFLEKRCPSRDYCKPAGIWLTGLYLCSLIELRKAPILDQHLYQNTILEGSKYLKSLQCFDARWDKAIGGFHEVYPGHEYSAPRDAATGAYALIALYLETGQAEYLDRAIRFADWYSTHGSDQDGFPWDDYDLSTGEGTSRKRGDWQAGGALVYYQLLKITGDQKWKKPLKKVLDVLEAICADGPKDDTAYTFHGDCTISIGNDDFANTVLLAGYEIFKEQRYLKLFATRLRTELARQDQRGAFPGYGGTFVTALELLETLDVAAAWGVEILPAKEILEPLLKAARFGLSLQVVDDPSRFMLGGVYGQSNYAHARDVVHGRDTAYALQLWLRLAGFRAATFTVLGWGKA
jgi:Glycosyl hydrolase family 76